MYNTPYTNQYFNQYQSSLVNYLSPNQNQFPISNDYFSNELSSIREWNRRNNAKNALKTSLSNNNINPANVSTQAVNNLNGSAVNNFNDYYAKQLAIEEERLGMMKDYSNTQKALGITNTTMNAITGLTQLGLGIDAYIQNKKLNKQAIKNAELSNQQLERDMEYIKNERNRLNRIRSNTNNSINAKSSTSRVYA